MLRDIVSGGVVLVVLTLVLAPVAATPVGGQAGDTVTLTVSVVTDRGTPIGGATVVASWDGGSTQATTAGNGKVFVDVPTGETVALDVRHDSYTRNSPFRLTVEEDREVTVEAYPSVSLTYTVSDADGNAVPGATVTVVDSGERLIDRGTTDASGRYTVDDIASGSYRISISRRGFYNYTTTESPSQDRSRQVTLERGTVSLTVGVYDPHFDPPRPVPNATVTAGDVGSVRTVDGPTASIGIPVNTRVELAVEKDGYRGSSRTVSVGEEATRVNVSVTRTSNLTLEPANRRIVVGETVVVEVRDAYGDPAEGVTVLIDGESAGTTDAQGEFAVPIESSGSHEIRARGHGVYSNAVTVEGVTTGEAGTGDATPTEGTETGTTGSLAPGFGALAAVVALLALGIVARYSRR
jgi:hypothetical protein